MLRAQHDAIYLRYITSSSRVQAVYKGPEVSGQKGHKVRGHEEVQHGEEAARCVWQDKDGRRSHEEGRPRQVEADEEEENSWQRQKINMVLYIYYFYPHACFEDLTIELTS